ncbi:Uncharacterised protein [Sphingobacterium daejeonense]|nr:Uncharacterised protein [Sphingobacterium daejeonense]
MNIEELSLQGKHNVYNNMASGLVAKVQELRKPKDEGEHGVLCEC